MIILSAGPISWFRCAPLEIAVSFRKIASLDISQKLQIIMGDHS